MPAVKAHLLEVNLAERHQQRQEYQKGKQRAEHRQQSTACSVEFGNKLEGEVANGTDADSYGKRPVFAESDDSIHGVSILQPFVMAMPFDV